MAVSPEVMEYLNSHVEKVISEAKEIISTVVNKEVEIEFLGVEEYNFENISSIYPEEVVDVTFNIKEDPEGKFHLFIPKPAAALVGSLMMMMEEDDPEFNEEEHLDAMKETVNQILGSIATNLKEDLGAEIGFDNIEGQVIPVTEDLLELPDLATGTMKITIGETDPLDIVTVFTSSSVQALLGGGDSAEAGEAEEDDLSDSQEITADELAGLVEEVGEDNFELDGVLEDDMPSMPDAPTELPHGMPAGDAHHGAEESRYTVLHDLTFPVSIELGRTKMLIKDILDLGHGSVIEFDKLAGDPVDLLISEKKIAEGEVVVIDEHFGIRITSMQSTGELLKDMK